jgi:hypothetical protein
MGRPDYKDFTIGLWGGDQKWDFFNGKGSDS